MAKSTADMVQSTGAGQQARAMGPGQQVRLGGGGGGSVGGAGGDLQREETRINCGFLQKKTSCTVANGGVRRKNKLYGGCNT